MSTSLRRAVLLCGSLAPLGWLMFWAVFHTVPGQDWVVFHTAAARYFAHDLAMLADPRAFTDEMNRSHAAWFAKPITVLHPFIYPPVTLMLALAFCWLPYLVSLACFLGVTAAFMLAALLAWVPAGRDRAWLIAGVLACPATAYVLGSGQLSFLVAGAVLAGMALLETRPFAAGLVLSLLCLKPQFVPLIPVALLAGRHWRAVAGGFAGGIGLVCASLIVVGPTAWAAWIGFATGRTAMLGQMIDVVRLYDQSVHTCLHMLGASEMLAGAGQIAATVVSAACVFSVFARRTAPHRRLIVLLYAMVFGAPHVGDYDLMLTAIAASLVLVEARHAPAPVWLAAGVWLSSMVNPPALIAVLGLPWLTALSAMSPLLTAALMVRSTAPFLGRPHSQLTML